MKYYVPFLLGALICCKTKNEVNGIDLYPVSYEVYRLNFIDEESCKDCISSSFLTRIDLGTIMKEKYLVYTCTNQKEVSALNDCFTSGERKDCKQIDIDNTFVVSFHFRNKKKLIYSFMGRDKWATSNSMVEPQKDVFQLIKSHSKIKDLTDYANIGTAVGIVGEQ